MNGQEIKELMDEAIEKEIAYCIDNPHSSGHSPAWESGFVGWLRQAKLLLEKVYTLHTEVIKTL